MTDTVGAIDIGSNALRIAIATLHPANPLPIIVASDRELLRLGADVFTTGRILESSFEKAAHALNRFKALAQTHGASSLRAVATSAVREATNRDEFKEFLSSQTGIEIEIIDGVEEGRLVQRAVSATIGLQHTTALLFDIGGGSTECSLCHHGSLLDATSFPIGTTRFANQNYAAVGRLDRDPANRAIGHSDVEKFEEQTRLLKQWIVSRTAQHPVTTCVGTGGTINGLADLHQQLFGGSNLTLTQPACNELMRILLEKSEKQREVEYRLTPDRAQSILIALKLLLLIIESAGAHEATVPHVGLKDGILLEQLMDREQGESAAQNGNNQEDKQ